MLPDDANLVVRDLDLLDIQIGIGLHQLIEIGLDHIFKLRAE
jgi:hypothetical protein